MDDKRLGLTSEEAQTYIPLRASIAFDHQMLRLAEEDWLAHILVGYFQESTAAYYDQCCHFYQEVERHYDLSDFFEGWKGHIRLDHDYGHASAFLDALESDEAVDAARVEASLQNALLTVQFLVYALDQIVAEDRLDDRIVLRRPLTDASSSADNNAILLQLTSSHWQAVQSCTVADLLETLDQDYPLYIDSATSRDVICEQEVAFIKMDLAASFCRALSYGKGHAEIVGLGRVLEALAPWLHRRQELEVCTAPSSWAAAVGNFLRELATMPEALILAVEMTRRHCYEFKADLDLLSLDSCSRPLSELAHSYALSAEKRSAVITTIAQFREVLGSWPSCSPNLSVDIFH